MTIYIKNEYDVAALFPKTVAEVNQMAKDGIALAEERFDAILKISTNERTFKNTAKAYDQMNNDLSRLMGIMQNLEMTTPDDNMRNACHENSIKLQQLSIDKFFKPEIYTAFKEYVDLNIKNEKLNSEEKYFIDEAMQGFIRDGFNLPSEKFEQVKKIQQELAALTSEFEANYNTDQSFITATNEELAGVNERLLQTLKKNQEGKFILHCDYPTAHEVRENCTNAATRKAHYLAYENRAYPKNAKLLTTIINKRDELAKILGFENFAALDINDQMAKNPETVKSFYKELANRASKKAITEIATWTKDLPASVHLSVNGKVEYWDIEFIKNCYLKKCFQIDHNKIAEYFEAEKTLNAIFNIYKTFLGLEFKIYKPSWAWHEDVKLLEVHKKQNNELIGFIYLDLYPRLNKYPHACMMPLSPALKESTPAIITIIANFPKSTATNPSLLKFDDVETFFHEFGHAMHGVLGKTELASYSGTGVKKDFVEVPSQMFEEWMYDHKILKQVSSHYKTGKPITDELIGKLIALKKFDRGTFLMRQIYLSFLSLSVFENGRNKDLDAITQSLYEKYMPYLRFEPKTHMYASFGHLVGYNAKYYGYMWAKVFSLDLFYRIKERGLLNENIGQELIEKVLSKGGSVNPNELLRAFLGREPTMNAFFEDLGIK